MNIVQSYRLVSVLLAGSLSSCNMMGGDEVGRIPFNKAVGSEIELTLETFNSGFKAQSLDLVTGDVVSLWTDLDIEYEGELKMDYIVYVISSANDTVESLQALPLEVNVSVRSVETTFGNKHAKKHLGKMSTLEIKEEGTYSFSAVLRSAVNKTLVIEKADLVLRKKK